MQDKIYLKNMVFYGFHGTYEFERELGQRFYIDLEITTDFSKAAKTDHLHDTIDYVFIYQKTKKIVENNRFHLLEKLICRIAEEVLESCEIAAEVKVKVRKPAVPINGVLDYVELETILKR